ncbi:alpha-2-macroglobulin-like protein [Plakobranchus ocellatus]|uniref:Alpha-2-macroglobulin-like protein n=1 Tax=Plakobranchus ocellatus TaxID=259542 RepID=A0AAV4BBH5_9GAST|nr:alpha-2-macroglobulin-like protein [Plakobranchus ocellatus]
MRVEHFAEPAEVKLEFKENWVRTGQQVDLKLKAAPGSICSVGVVDQDVAQLTPANIFDKIGEYTHPWYGPNSIIYGDDYGYCTEQIKKRKGIIKPGDERWQYSSEYVDSFQAFKMSGSLVMTDRHVETRPCRRFEDFKPPPEVPEEENFMDEETFPTSAFPENWLWTLHKVR